MPQASYSKRVRRATWLAFATAPLAGLAAAMLLRTTPPGENFWLVFPALLLVGAIALWACLPWWNRLDDMQKEYHTVSWYWGGIGGGIVALMALIAASGTHSAASLGGLCVLLGQTLAFVAFWAVWAWRRRGAGE